jgi:hypothetical protein
MISTQPQKAIHVILGTLNRATYFGRLVKIQDGRVYLTDAMRLPWAFDFEAMAEMAVDGPPNQQSVAWPKRKGRIILFRPEEMLECEAEAADKWLDMRWLREPVYQAPAISAPTNGTIDPFCTLGT